MTLVQLRTLLRRQIQDVDGIQWTDSECNSALNVAYTEIQGEIQTINPEALITWDYMNSVAATNWYPLPPTFGIIGVSIKPATGDDYGKLDHKLYEDIRNLDGETMFYTIRGEWIGVFPAPTNSVTLGIELMHAGIHELADDDEIPKIKLPLHVAIMYGAKIHLLGDTTEETKLASERYEKILQNIPRWYGQHYDDIENFSPRGL